MYFIRPMLGIFLTLMLLTGILYPLAVTGAAQVFFPTRANGSLLIQNGQVLGSYLIGQPFNHPAYFWPRPSATPGHPYNALDRVFLTGSAGSNLGPLSQFLIDQVRARTQTLLDADPENKAPIPVDLVTASASGLDPHISPAAAYYQVSRVAKARGLSEARVNALVDEHIEGRFLGILGEPRVNILLLNLALDQLQ